MNSVEKTAQQDYKRGQLLQRKEIFGRTTAFELANTTESQRLIAELDLYPSASPGAASDLTISNRFPHEDVISRNPAIHREHGTGFAADIGSLSVSFQFSDGCLTNIDYALTKKDTVPRRAYQRLRSMQFTSESESIGQSVHELLLVPSTFFLRDYFVLHAASVLSPNGEAILIGGTGGVGKTSAELNLCTMHGYRFMADDITVLDSQGTVFPNLAYPKVYGYNIDGNAELSRRVFVGRGPLDRVHWALHSRRGLSRVRRRISPAELYRDYAQTPTSISTYLLLARASIDDFQLEPLSPSVATLLSLQVLRTEYNVVYNHIRWHEYNRKLMNAEPLITEAQLLGRWSTGIEGILRRASCMILRIPIGAEHDAIVNKVSSTVRDFHGQ